MKTLKFRPEFVDEILQGAKTTTWRMFDDKNLTVGDKIELLDKQTLEKFADAEITDIREKPLGSIEASDFEGHNKYENTESMLKHYHSYYGDRVTLETQIKIITFKLV